MKNRPVGVIGWLVVLAVGCALMPIGHGFGAENNYDVWRAPSGQPEQMWSQVHYDPNLTDPFFESNEWSYPWWIIKHPDGHFEDTSTGIPPEKEPPRLKHTAKCYSNSQGEKHLVRFCVAKLLDVNTIDLLVYGDDPSFLDDLRVRIRNGMFTYQFGIGSKVLPTILPDIVSKKERQKLILEKKVYRKGDVIKGRIDIEYVQEITNPKYFEKYGKHPTTIHFYGVFKTIVE